jgi:hypothetical protein
MVTVLLRGGLGNQMFEYAAGLALAHKNNTHLLLDTTMIRDRFPRRQISFREYDLDVFTLKPQLTTFSRVANVFPVPGLWTGLDMSFIGARALLGTQKLVREKSEHVFDPAVLAAGSDAFLWGFWQSPKYFAGAEAEIRNAFKFRHSLSGEALALAGKIKNSNSVAIHVRRGDYLSSKYRHLYGETNIDYYLKAIEYIAEHIKLPSFFVFSDDVAWCKENIKPPFPTTYVDDASRGPKSSFHMQLMSLCKHNVIANSTFSWWPAWLNADKDKIVVAPKKWLASSEYEEDIIPEGWVKL